MISFEEYKYYYQTYIDSIFGIREQEFEIIEFSDSNYKLDSIGVIFTCPEFYENGFFEVGKTYTITVADENQADFGWSIPNESILTKYKLDKKE